MDASLDVVLEERPTLSRGKQADGLAEPLVTPLADGRKQCAKGGQWCPVIRRIPLGIDLGEVSPTFFVPAHVRGIRLLGDFTIFIRRGALEL